MSTCISAHFKEDEKGLRAEVYPEETGYTIRYCDVRTEEFPGKPLFYVEDVAEKWALDIKNPDNINPGITGNAYGVVINMTKHTVTVGDVTLIDGDPKLTSLFHRAYVLGREHKKLEIRQVLNLS